MLNTVRFNVFAPETADGDETAALVNQLHLVASLYGGPLAIVAVIPAHQGSYDIELAAPTSTLERILGHYGVPALDAEWGYRTHRG